MEPAQSSQEGTRNSLAARLQRFPGSPYAASDRWTLLAILPTASRKEKCPGVLASQNPERTCPFSVAARCYARLVRSSKALVNRGHRIQWQTKGWHPKHRES